MRQQRDYRAELLGQKCASAWAGYHAPSVVELRSLRSGHQQGLVLATRTKVLRQRLRTGTTPTLRGAGSTHQAQLRRCCAHPQLLVGVKAVVSERQEAGPSPHVGPTA